jgi:hypothetical protein
VHLQVCIAGGSGLMEHLLAYHPRAGYCKLCPHMQVWRIQGPQPRKRKVRHNRVLERPTFKSLHELMSLGQIERDLMPGDGRFQGMLSYLFHRYPEWVQTADKNGDQWNLPKYPCYLLQWQCVAEN